MSRKFELAAILQLPELPSHVEAVNQALLAAVESAVPRIKQPAQRVVRGGGKRVRASLVIAIAAARGHAVDQRVISAATAVELTHLASLVHDDIIDESDTRWNQPTVNAQEGTADAVLVGDYLLARACALGSSLSGEIGAALADTITAICNAESQELTDAYNVERSIESLRQVMHDKTASLLGTACQIGGLVGKASAAEQQALKNFGENFGLAFQLVDDLLDFISTSELFGKPVGNDVREGVYTLPLLLALRGPQSKKLRTQLAAHESPRETLLETDAFPQVLYEIQDHSAAAASSLADQPALAHLAKLPQAYVDWALANLVDPRYRELIRAR